MPATRRLILIIIVLLFLLLFIAVPGVSWAQTPQNPWQDPARELAKKIVAVTGPRPAVALAVRNISSLSGSEAAAARLALEAELRAAGLRLVAKPNGAPELRITLSGNLQGFLWIAEFFRDDSREVAMVSVSYLRPKPSLPADFQIAVNKQFILESEKPILDFLLSSPFYFGKGEVLVLDPEHLSLFRSENQSWVLQQALPIPLAVSWPRDPRGRLERDGPAITAYLPGMKCENITWQSPRLDCTTVTQADALWNLSGAGEDDLAARFLARRNFFEGPLPLTSKPEPVIPPFFNVVGLGGGPKYVYWILSGTDAHVRIYSEEARRGDLKLVQTLAGWGSELAPVRSSCGRHEQLLATRPGDWTEADAIQAFEIVDGKAVAVSAPIQFPGPITALWSGDLDDFAHAVVRNLETGRYEAYNLSLSCGR